VKDSRYVDAFRCDVESGKQAEAPELNQLLYGEYMDGGSSSKQTKPNLPCYFNVKEYEDKKKASNYALENRRRKGAPGIISRVSSSTGGAGGGHLDNLPLPRPRLRQDSVRSNKRKRSSSRRTPSRIGSYASPSSEVLASQRRRTSSRRMTGPRERAPSPSRLPRDESSTSIMSVKTEVATATAAAVEVERSLGSVDIDDDDHAPINLI